MVSENSYKGKAKFKVASFVGRSSHTMERQGGVTPIDSIVKTLTSSFQRFDC